MQNRIAALREARGWTQSDLADRLGVHWQTVSRMETGATSITTSRIAELARIFGVSDAEVMFPPSAVRLVPVTGAVEAGVWRDAAEWGPASVYQVPVPDRPAWRGFALHGAEVRGESMNRRYPAGSVVIFREYPENRRSLDENRAYIVDRIRHGERERTVKLLRKTPHGLWLTPDSDDPSHLPFPLEQEGDTDIHVVGRVVWAHRNEDDDGGDDA